VNYVTKLHVCLVGFVSLGTAALVQLDWSNQEDSKTGRVGIPGRPVPYISGENGQIVLVQWYIILDCQLCNKVTCRSCRLCQPGNGCMGAVG
jgi:hypothetical protein